MCYMFITILHKLHFNILPVEISWTKLNCLVYWETEKTENWQKERMKEKDSSKGLRRIASGVAPLMSVCATVYKGPFFTNTANQRRTVL